MSHTALISGIQMFFKRTQTLKTGSGKSERMSYLKKRLLLPRLIAAFACITTTLPSFAQSLDPKNPAPLSNGITRGTIDSFGGEQFWTTTIQRGHFKIAFIRSGAQEGFNIAKPAAAAVIAPKVPGSTITFKDNANGVVFEGNAAAPTRIVLMIEPAKSPLVRQTNDYTIEVEGNVGSAIAAAVTAETANASNGRSGEGSAIVGVYSVNLNDYGAAKFSADGSIVTASGARGTWSLFDAGTKTYVITIGNNRWTLTLQPGRGLVDNNNNLQFTSKH